MHAVTRILLLVALAAGLVAAPATVGPATAGPPTPAALADLCDEFDLRDQAQVRDKAADADTIFEGRVLRSRKRVQAGGKPDFAHTVEVQAVYSGDISTGDQVTVVTKRTDDDGLGRLPRRDRFLFFAQAQSNETLLASRCGGTTRLRKDLPDAARAVLDRVLSERPDDGNSGAAVTLEQPAGGTDAPPSLGRVAAPGVAIVLLGLLGLLLVVGLDSRRRP